MANTNTYPGQTKWVEIAEGFYSTSDEGYRQSVSLILVGGNSYVDISNVSIVEYSHHQSSNVLVENKKIITTGSDPTLGYVINGNVLKVYVKTEAYNSNVYITGLSFGYGDFNKIIKNQNATIVEPSGIVYVQ